MHRNAEEGKRLEGSLKAEPNYPITVTKQKEPLSQNRSKTGRF